MTYSYDFTEHNTLALKELDEMRQWDQEIIQSCTQFKKLCDEQIKIAKTTLN